MKLGRTLIALILCVAVPLSATSGALVPLTCPSQASTHESAASTMSDCCDTDQDRETKTQDHHKNVPCKPGAECKSCASPSLALGQVAIATFTASHLTATDFRTVLNPVRNPTGLWRPPRAI